MATVTRTQLQPQLQPIIDIPIKKKVNMMPLSECKTIIAADTSGSVQGRIERKQDKIIGLLINPNTKYISWSSRARMTVYNGNINDKFYGGTSPQTIFTTGETKRYVKESDIFIITTDGDITSRDVHIMSNVSTPYIRDKQLVIGIIIGSQRNVGQLNVSVFASLMAIAPNFLGLFVSTHNTTSPYARVIYSTGDMKKLYPIGEFSDTTSIDDLPKIDLRKINDIMIKNTRVKLPSGYVEISRTDTVVRAINIDMLMSSEITIDEFKALPWDQIIQMGKVQGKLQVIRQFIDKFYRENIEMLRRKIEIDIEKRGILKANSEKVRIVQRILHISSKNTNDETLLQLRKRLCELNQLISKENQIVDRIKKKELQPFRSLISKIRSLLHEQESSGYSLTAFTGSSNRARRAQVIEFDDDIKLHIDHSQSPSCRDIVSMEDGPAVLFFGPLSSEDSELMTSDVALNWPLAFGSKITFKPTIISAEIADAIQKMGKWVDRTPIAEPHAWIPCSLHSVENRKYVRNVLKQIFYDGKDLGNIFLLLFAGLDHMEGTEWFDNDIRIFMMNQILKYTQSTVTFTEEGARVSVKTAMETIIDGRYSEYLQRQPITSMFLMLRTVFNPKFGCAQPVDIVITFTTYAKVRIIRSFIGRFLQVIKMCSTDGIGIDAVAKMKKRRFEMTQKLLGCIYTIKYGIPQQDTLHSTNILAMLDTILPPNSKMIHLEAIKRLCKVLNIKIDDIITPYEAVIIIESLLSITEHNKLEAVYSDLCVSDDLFMSIITNNISGNILPIIEKKRFGRFHQDSRKEIPSYAFYNGPFSGPSKLFVTDGKCMLSPGKYTIGQIESQIVKNLRRWLESEYGTCVPSKTSAHIPLHTIIAKILTSEFPDVDVITQEMIVRIMTELAKTDGRKGNIYRTNIEEDSFVICKDFMRIRKEHNFTTGNNNTDITIRHKIASELKYYGITCIDGYYTITEQMLITAKERYIIYTPMMVKAILSEFINE